MPLRPTALPQFKYLTLVSLTTALLMLGGRSLPVASSPTAFAPPLGTAARFVGLAASTFTNTGAGVYVGDVGVSPGSEVIGFPPGSVRNGEIHSADGVAAQAQIDAMAAYVALEGQPCDVNLNNQNLGGLTLTPGVYCFSSEAQLTGALVLDGLNNPLAVWVFKIGSQLTTASNASVGLINGGQGKNVFWQMGSSATLGAYTTFQGNLFAMDSVTLVNGASLMGRAFGLTGAVTMDTTDAPRPISNTPLFEFFYLPLVGR